MAPKREKAIIVKDRDICGKSEHYDERLMIGNTNGIQNAVVSLTKVWGGKPLSTLGTNLVLDQRGCTYAPHILVVPVNQKVTILNNDGVLHNIHTFSTRNRPVNLAQTKVQKELEMKFSLPERIQIKCDVHGWMSAWFVVVDHPYYAVTNAEGEFSLADVPPGTYTLTCWQEKLGEQSATVTIGKSSTVKFDFHYANGTQGP
jgi:plastocyanin